jgi:hypothetical protein
MAAYLSVSSYNAREPSVRPVCTFQTDMSWVKDDAIRVVCKSLSIKKCYAGNSKSSSPIGREDQVYIHQNHAHWREEHISYDPRVVFKCRRA